MNCVANIFECFAVTVIEGNEKKVTVMSAKPKEIPFLPAPPKPSPSPVINNRGPSYNDAFAQFLQNAKTKPETTKTTSAAPKPLPPDPPATIKAQQTSVIQTAPKAPRKRVQPQLQTPIQQGQLENFENNQNQRVKTEKIPQAVYAIQENTVVQDGKQQKLYYTILNSPSSPSSNNSTYPQLNVNGQYYGHQQQHSF